MISYAVCSMAFLLFTQAGAQTGPAEQGLGQIRVAAPFPTLSLPRLTDGRPASLQDFRNKPVLLIVFASW